MNIELKHFGESRVSSTIGNFEINSNVTARILETSEQFIVKLRNTRLEEVGRIFKIENINTINSIEFAGELYENLKYISHEIYIHHPEDKDLKMVLCEDLNITFEKVK